MSIIFIISTIGEILRIFILAVTKKTILIIDFQYFKANLSINSNRAILINTGLSSSIQII